MIPPENENFRYSYNLPEGVDDIYLKKMKLSEKIEGSTQLQAKKQEFSIERIAVLAILVALGIAKKIDKKTVFLIRKELRKQKAKILQKLIDTKKSLANKLNNKDLNIEQRN